MRHDHLASEGRALGHEQRPQEVEVRVARRARIAHPTLGDEPADLPHAVLDHEPGVDQRICRGPFIAQKGYGTALRQWGYTDGRLQPYGPLTPHELAQLPEP